MKNIMPDRPAFCMFCGKDYKATLPHCDVATPIIGPCCKDTEAAKEFDRVRKEILSTYVRD